MSLRDEIVRIVDGEMVGSCRVVDGRIAVEADYWNPAADRILALVRDALTSDAAVEAAVSASYGDAVWNYEETEIVEGRVGTVEEIITAALDAALGTEADDD